ncbi:DUF2029 domain-containing protein [Streptomyces sp. A7024]|uniref:DUF2029 domain-containing protein n=1 Tax=Streptomyces coryli TaxID=1128680 RepID=A0A6G4U8H7_9ACTN|nr:glycosyltransferase family 87 protein [Streptomyces coryli]NGN68423.1 DUF2029 domain-containing protein [Streptomyces coryli]
MTTGRIAGPVAAWAMTRVVLLLLAFKVISISDLDVTSDVHVIYQGWYDVLRTGAFPVDDVSWQYPPAAALAILSPALLPFLDYAHAFFVLACVADAIAFALFLRAGTREGRSLAGVWVWIAGVALLGPTAYARYDLMVTALAVGALLTLGRHPRAGGALAAVGAMVKVWPALLLLGTPRGRDTRRSWGTAVVTAGAVAAAFAVAMPGGFTFLTAQKDRGTEVESLGALVFHIARHHGWEGRVALNYGSMEFLGPGVTTVSNIALALSIAAMLWLVLWRLRAREFTPTTLTDAGFAALLLFTTTSRVISPQYMIWLVGLAAVALTLNAAHQAVPAGLVLAATALTLVEFPLYFGDVVGSTGFGIALMAARNGLLVIATYLACRRLWRSTVSLKDRPGRRRAQPSWARRYERQDSVNSPSPTPSSS